MIEEIGIIDPTLDMGRAADHVTTTERWGPSYFIDTTENSDQVFINYFVAEVAKEARYALPYVKNIELMLRWGLSIKKYLFIYMEMN